MQYNSNPDYLAEAIHTCDVIFKSPGVKLPTELITYAHTNEKIITSQTEWFFQHCPAPIIGITGTKGKGTTSSLIYEIFSAAHVTDSVYLTGNIGKTQPLEFLENLSTEDVVVYELSSFQLEFLTQSPHIGVCLMVTEDHLDYHADLDEYVSAKAAISKYQTKTDHLIYNIDYSASRAIGQLGDGMKWHVTADPHSTIERGAKINGENILIFENGMQINTIDCSTRLLRGKHNLENIAASCLAAHIAGISGDTIRATVQSFKGLEHRLQFVIEHKGVAYYNDSISTIPDTTIAAVKSFTEPVILLLGGASKQLDYSHMIQFLEQASNVKSVVCVGQTGAELHQIFKQSSIASKVVGPFDDFQEAVQHASLSAAAGDVVLLSPAATSFDMFANYTERGQKFIDIVTHL